MRTRSSINSPSVRFASANSPRSHHALATLSPTRPLCFHGLPTGLLEFARARQRCIPSGSAQSGSCSSCSPLPQPDESRARLAESPLALCFAGCVCAIPVLLFVLPPPPEGEVDLWHRRATRTEVNDLAERRPTQRPGPGRGNQIEKKQMDTIVCGNKK